MKYWKNILLTVLAALMLVGFAWAVTSPTVTEEAAARHDRMRLGSSSSSDHHDTAGEEGSDEDDLFSFMDDLPDQSEPEEEEDPFAFLNDIP